MKRVSLSLCLFFFLTPLALAQDVPKQEPGYLGCNLIDLTYHDRHMLTAKGLKAVSKVGEVLPETPAAQAALHTNDIILAFQGSAIKDTNDLIAKIRASGSGTRVTLDILRDGKKKTVEVTLEKSPFVDLEKPDTAHGLSRTRTVKDLAYYDGQNADPEKHKLDLVFPASTEPFPVVMWIHGGGWSIGDRSDATALALRFAERGVGVAAISHRLSSAAWLNPEASQSGVVHPAHVQDCAQAFAWLRQHIQKYGGDPNRLFIGGHSSGAHLATLLATNPRYLAEHNVSPNMIKGVIAVEGAYDIERYRKVLIELESPELAEAHIQAVFGPKEENWRDASPTTYLSGNTVPILVVTGEEEGYRRYAHHFQEAAEQAGKRTIRFLDAKQRVHATIILMMTRKEPDPVRKTILDFIRGE